MGGAPIFFNMEQKNMEKASGIKKVSQNNNICFHKMGKY